MAMPHCTSWNQILVKTFITIEFGELKQRVIAGDGDPTFILDNKQWEMRIPIVILTKEENNQQQTMILDG